MRLRAKLAAHLRDPVYVNGYALVLNAGLGAALGFAFWMVAARRFEAEDLGFGAAVVSAATLAALVGKAGFDAALIRYAPGSHPRYLRKLLLYAALASAALTALVCAAILALAGGGVESLAPLRTPLAATGFALLATGTAVAWVLDAFFISEQAAAACLWRNAAFHGVKLFAPLLIAASLAAYAVPLAWAVGLAASLAVALALVPRLLRRRARAMQGERLDRREVAAYAAKNYVLNLSEFVPGLVLPVLVLETLGPGENAAFFLAWTIANVAFLASKAVAQSAFAALVRDGSPIPALRKGALLSALVLGPATLALALGADLALGLFGPAYAGAAPLLRLLALSIPAVALSNLYLSYLKARRAGWELTLLPAATLVTLLVALPLALAAGGLRGVGLVWLAVSWAAGLYAAARLVASLRSLPHAQPRAALRRRAHEG